MSQHAKKNYYGQWSKGRRLPTRLYRTLFIGLVVSSALISAGAQANTPTVYGKLNLTVQHYSFEKLDFAPALANPATYQHTGATAVASELEHWAIESNASRLGVKGDIKINDDLKLIYVIEYGIDADNGTNSNGREFTQRNIYAGLSGHWGTLLAGKNDTPLKALLLNPLRRGELDRFNDAALADVGSYLVGENRPDNVLQYNSPLLWQSVEFKVAAVQHEQSGVASSLSNLQDDNDLATGYSASVAYNQDLWFLSAAVDSNVVATDAIRFVGEVKLGDVKIGTILQSAEQHDSKAPIAPFTNFVGSSPSSSGAQNGLNPLSEWDGSNASAFKKQNGYVLNALWTLQGPWSAKFQYAHTKTTPSNAQYSAVTQDAYALGVDYKLNDSARLYSYYAALETQGDAAIGTVKPSDRTFAFGLDFRF